MQAARRSQGSVAARRGSLAGRNVGRLQALQTSSDARGPHIAGQAKNEAATDRLLTCRCMMTSVLESYRMDLSGSQEGVPR